MIYLAEKSRIPGAVCERIIEILDDPNGALVLAPLDMDVVMRLGEILRSQAPDMPDRIIAATALACEVPLVTRDAKLRSLSMPTVW